ncbi:MAG: hypothetical protein Q9208_003706 [Pyrenodesmia sp. 3 TL-2023]
MASALTENLYTTQQTVFAQNPHHPPSPPIEDYPGKRTLPSIQSLIGVMPESPQPDPGSQVKTEQPSSLPPPPALVPSNAPQEAHMQIYGQPPSPSATSSPSSAAPAGPYYGPTKPGSNVDPQLERHPPPSASHSGHSSMPSSSESQYQNSPYPPPTVNPVTYSYPNPSQAATAPPPMYYQRPLPTNFPPPPPPPPSVSMDPAIPNTQQQQHSPVDQGSPWQHQHQHHHYISPSSSAALSGQPQDRYVCQTCNKAFSRPSSLRIHSHSHTGEKPFKCPHPGCGKAFSVRSNMKRHERGCHGGSSPGEI